jgi:tripartite ATP-independent transporter DctP family solute receptor
MTPTTTRRPLLAGGAMLLASRAVAEQTTTLKLYSPGYDIVAAMLAYEVLKRTAGRYQVEQIIGFDVLTAALGEERAAGGEQALLEGARNGDLDLVIVASTSAIDIIPELQVLDLPFLFRDYTHARAVLDGPIGRDILAKSPANGPIGLAWTENGFRHLTNSKRPVRTPEDLKGLRLRTPKSSIMVEAFQTLGAEVTPTPFTQAVFDALARGTLDAQENTITTMWEFEVFKQQRYLSLTGHI